MAEKNCREQMEFTGWGFTALGGQNNSDLFKSSETKETVAMRTATAHRWVSLWEVVLPLHLDFCVFIERKGMTWPKPKRCSGFFSRTPKRKYKCCYCFRLHDIFSLAYMSSLELTKKAYHEWDSESFFKYFVWISCRDQNLSVFSPLATRSARVEWVMCSFYETSFAQLFDFDSRLNLMMMRT